jgi:DUF4097 and DUF4098 domain-containing protein YvlB
MVSGDARLEKANCSEEILCKLISGDLTLIDSSSGVLHVNTVSGDVNLDGATIDELDFKTLSGNTNFRRCKIGDIKSAR